jgi:hypothetical protein
MNPSQFKTVFLGGFAAQKHRFELWGIKIVTLCCGEPQQRVTIFIPPLFLNAGWRV